MKQDRRNVNDTNQQESDSTEETREAMNRATSMHEGGDTPSQQSQKMPFAPPDRGRGKDEEIERTLEDRNVEFRREDEETNKSGDSRIGTHDRKY